MPVAVHISPQHMSKEDYARVVGELEASGRDRMFAAMQGAGVDAGTVGMHPLHSGAAD
jgi:hypothetical protein